MGGGMMRTAAKAVAAGGFRAAHSPRVDGAWRSARPPPSAAAVPGQVAEGAPLLYAASPERSAPVDGWEVVGRGEEELLDALHPAPPPRLVFGPVPTLEEAKEATSDLKDAVELLYFSPTASSFENSSVTAKSILSESSCLESVESKNKCAAIIPSMPRHVVQAFSLLQGSPEAQDVVASLASDQSVWDAVMKNEKVMEFYKTHQINSPPVETSGYQEESVSEDGKSMESSDVKEAPPSSENGFMSFVQSIKVKVTEVVNNLSDFFNDLFKDFMGTAEAKTTAGDSSHFNMGVGASFFALAIAAILVILVKRG